MSFAPTPAPGLPVAAPAPQAAPESPVSASLEPAAERGLAEGEGHALREQLDRMEALLAALVARQDDLAARLEALQDHANLVGYKVEQLAAGPPPRPPLALPLPLSRLRDLVVSPGPALAHLRAMAEAAVLTGTASVRDASGALHARVRPGRVARVFGRDFATLMFGTRGVVYRVRPHHPPVPARPRVLHVIPNVFVGGSTQLVVDLHERLGHRYDMQVVTAALPPGGRHEGMVIHQLPLGSPASAFALVLAAVAPDLIHFHYWGGSDRPWYEAALEAARASPATLVENVNTPVEPLRDARLHTYVFVSDHIRQVFAPDVTNGRVIHPGIDLDLFAPRPFAADSGDTIGMVYRLDRDKLDDASIEPLIAVARRRPKTRVLVVGDGDLRPVFLARTVAAGVRDNFEFTGTVPFAALPELYSRFRLFAAPVVQESFGQVTPFAMAMGQAVAGYRVGALPEILGGSETLADNADGLATLITDLLDAPDRLDELGAANRARARLFGLEGMIAGYADVYAQALGRPCDLMPGFPPAELYAEV
ncbi:glycosyltransferase family 4 protein [Xanthobacter sp. KR7-65]|uniref:glycosyltransferase family 4 protein n=1 Tax=Xanthobacter sp. KR7-65 TaxID=3156612 RepID=UPI0032B36E76